MNPRIAAWLFAGSLAASLLASSAWAQARDDRLPERVVSVGGALTEIVYALQAQAALVGVDTTSQHPEPARALTRVGYQRSLSAEGILSLSPDLMLITDDAGPPEVLDQVRGAGIEILTLSSDHDLDGVRERIRTLAERFDRHEAGERLVARIDTRMHALRRRVDASPIRPTAVFLLGASPGSSMASGTGTAADAMLHAAGARNAFDTFSGYKAVGAESLIAASPEAIVVVAHGDSDAVDIVADTLALPGVASTPAGLERRIIVADALRLLGFGPRIEEASADLYDALRAPGSEPRHTVTRPQ